VNGIVAGTENTASPSFSAAGTYSAVITNTNSGCSTFINNNVVTAVLDNTTPVLSLTGSVNTGTINCSTSTVIATASVTPANDLSYTWASASGTGISGPANQASATFTASGNYTLSVTNTVTGCSSVLDASSIFTVFVDTIAPVADFKFVTGCAKDSVKFIDQSSTAVGNITDWTWSFGDGNNSLMQNPANVYSQVNSYNVSLSVRAANGCVSATNGTVTLIPPVLADFVPGGGEYLINQPISFTNQSSGSSSYLWSFGDGTTTSSTDPTHAFTSLGSYDVMLVSSNNIGCTDSISFRVNVKPAGYAIPGGFTPNGDGVNDGFSVLGGPFSSYELRVFNAWGNEVFVTNSQNNKWDGSYRDAQQPAGTYIYIFNGQIQDGEYLKLKGEVHIIR
jgi:gliding motility-associated-like protein